jgi:hypothetical protein
MYGPVSGISPPKIRATEASPYSPTSSFAEQHAARYTFLNKRLTRHLDENNSPHFNVPGQKTRSLK